MTNTVAISYLLACFFGIPICVIGWHVFECWKIRREMKKWEKELNDKTNLP